jgi:hypothetical protein
MASADWSISQWQAPGDLPAMKNVGPEQWATSTNWATATIVEQSDGTWVQDISQNGAYFPCETAQGNPLEFDEFVAPNGWTSGSYPSAVPASLPTLSEMSSLTASATFTLEKATPSPGPTACRVNHGYANYGMILTDTAESPHQIFWYSVNIAISCIPAAIDAGYPKGNPGSDYYFCLQSQSSNSPYWFWTGSEAPSPNSTTSNGVASVNFGMQDSMPAYGYTNISDNNPHQLSFNLLSRLQSLISSGAYGVDNNLSHWQVSQFNFGQSDWGGSALATKWSGMATTWTTP